jgi:LysR family transcriptional regulator, glycine cleavage system transcriptional activator
VLISTRRQKLVHLNALRAFEAAARHLSFAAAAEELNVTPPAISQHIRALEEYLDSALFVRTKSGIALTPQARAAYPDIRDGLEQLAVGLGKLRGSGQDSLVTLTVPPSFAAKWLLPRIDRFREQHPDLDIRLDTTDRLVDLAAEGIDLGVRYGLGGYTDLQADKLFDEEVFPVCSPALLPGASESIGAAWLGRQTLIHDTTSGFDPAFPNWRTWLLGRGMREIDPSRGLQLNSSLLTIQAAIAGQGVALCRRVIAEGDVAAGRLVRPFVGIESTRCAYYVVYPPKALALSKVKLVRDWLFEEAAAQKREPA